VAVAAAPCGGGSAPSFLPLVSPLPFLHPRNPRSRSTWFGAPLVVADAGRRSPDSRYLWSDLRSPPPDLLVGCSSALRIVVARPVDPGRKGASPSVSKLVCVRGRRPRPPMCLLRSPASYRWALVGWGAGAKAMTAAPVGAANLLGGVTLLPPSLPL
jgi:hypothetical protein